MTDSDQKYRKDIDLKQCHKEDNESRKRDFRDDHRSDRTYRDRSRDRNRDRSLDRNRDRSRDRNRDRKRDRTRSRSHNRSRDKSRERSHKRDKSRDIRDDDRKSHKYEDYKQRDRDRRRSPKKKRNRSRSNSSSCSSTSSSAGSLGRELMELSSSESSDEDVKQKKAFIASKAAEYLQDSLKTKDLSKEERKRQKELIKSLETPEEKRLRRLAKKEAKERKRKLKMGWDEEYMGYTNADNPFGDANLHMTFNWKKKYEKMGLKNVSEEEIARMNRLKMEETKRELEKVKKRRLEREREMEARLEEQSRQQREKEAEQFKEWEKQEDFFHLKQAKLRSKLRIKEGRAKPIDLLARYINAFGDDIGADEDADKTEDMAAESKEPYQYLNGLRMQDLEDLEEDIKVYMTLDSDKNNDYWNDLKIIVSDELDKLRKYQSKNAVESREGINPAVAQDVYQIFNGKTPAQLEALQNEIEKKIRSNEEGIDIGYWETLLLKLRAHSARARLKELHEQNMIQTKNRLKSGFNVNKKPNAPLFPVENPIENMEQVPTATTSFDAEPHEESSREAEPHEDSMDKTFEPIDQVAKCIEDYDLGQYSPKLLSMNEIESGTLIIQPEDDIKQLEQQRRQVLRIESYELQKKSEMTPAEAAFEREARKGMTSDEVQFSVEEQIKQIDKQYSWTDKYRPRKPRYFNRVHTGFEWNKYNQTHYDVDNPPPKVVQGYKFNIFYPDLIDKSKTPQFKITPCPDNKDFAFIRFSAGPPYEDICFKIVNREWNYSYKSGFRSQFHNNILQLWFHFKRYRYRR